MPRAPRSEGRHLKGVSLATKLAVVIAAVVGVFMVVFGLVLGGFIRDTVRDQIKRSAAEAARAAAQAEVAAWTPYFDTVDQGLTPDEIQARVNEMDTFEYRAYENDGERKRTIEWNKRRFERFLGSSSKILAVELFRFANGERGKLVGSSYSGGMEFARLPGSEIAFGRGEAVEGVLTIGGERSSVIRGSYPVLGRGGEQEGEMAVYIHANAVDDATGEFKVKVAYSAMIIIFIGAGVSFLLGKHVTRPLRLLQDDIRTVAAGELDHHTKPHSSDEIGALARTFDQMTRSLKEAREHEREAARSQHQVAVAAEVTSSLYPSELPKIDGFDCAALHEATGQPGGEYYDVVPMPEGRFGFIVGGASGSGVPAALVMGMARAFLNVVARREADPGAVLREVNELISKDLRRGMFVTVLLVVLDPRDGSLRIANAGHPPMLLWKAGAGKLTVVHSEGIALGFDEGPVFDRTLHVVETELEPGDRAVCYTPGIAQVIGADGSELGDKRFGGLVKREANHPAETFTARVSATLAKFRGKQELTSDVTLLTVGRRPS